MAIAKKLTASAIASSLLLAIAGPAFAADLSVDAVATKMFDLGIVKGNGSNLNLDGTLTRAELITTIVRSFGMEQAALLSKGAPSFADVSATEWYSGWVAVAKNLAETKGVKLGVDANTFNPNGQLSKVEALVFVMKFIGVTPSTTTATWYEAWINEAVARGVITAEQGADVMATANTKATRGEAFIVIDRGYSFKDANGKSLYTTNIDTVLPTLNLTPAATTTEAEITLSGSVADNKGIASVVINGEAVEVANGAFSTTAALTVGKNEITVVVTDLAGNVLTKTYEVVRGNVDADTIEASDVTVVAGATANVEAKLVDKNGEAIENAAITGTSDLGTFENGVFTAGTKAGEGTLTLKSGDITTTVAVKVAAGALTKVAAATANVAASASVTLSAQDQYGNAITGATFTVKAGQTGAFVTGDQFLATAAGKFTVVATSNGTSVEGVIGVYSETVASLAVTAADKVVANGTTEVEVTVKALDANGNFIPTAAGTPTITANAGLTFGTAPAFVNGVSTFKIKADAVVAGYDLTIKADLNGKTGSLTVKPEAQVATAVVVTSDKDFVDTRDLTSADAASTVTVKVVDQAGVKMIAGEYNVNVTIAGPATFAQGATTKAVTLNQFIDATYAVNVTETAATGAITVSATANGLNAGNKVITAAVPQAVAAIKVTAPTTSTITVGDAVNTTLEYKVATTDKNGVPVTATGKSVKIVIGGIDMTKSSDLAKFDVKVDLGAGYAAHTLGTTIDAAALKGVKIYGTAAGNYSVQIVDAAATPALTASAVNSFSVKAGAVNKLVAPTTTAYEALRGEKVTVKYQVTDVAGNALNVAGIKVTTGTPAIGLKVNGSTSAVTVATDANGVATFELVAEKLTAVDAPFTLAVTALNGTTAIGAPANVTLAAVDTVVGSFDVVVADQAATPNVYVTAGQDAKLTVTVRDQLGYLMTGLTADQFVSNFKLQVNGADEAFIAGDIDVAGAANGVYVIKNVTLTKAGLANLALTTAKLAEAKTASASISVKAGAVARLIVVGAEATTDVAAYNADVTANVAKLYTVQLADANGNVINAFDNTADRNIELTYSDLTKYFTFADQDGLGLAGGKLMIAKGRNTVSFYATTSVEAGTITVADTAATGALTAATITLK